MKKEKSKKKHPILKFFGILIFLILIVSIAVFILDDSDEYEEAEATELTEYVSNLQKKGKSPLDERSNRDDRF